MSGTLAWKLLQVWNRTRIMSNRLFLWGKSNNSRIPMWRKLSPQEWSTFNINRFRYFGFNDKRRKTSYRKGFSKQKKCKKNRNIYRKFWKPKPENFVVNLMDSFDIANTVDVSVTNVGSCEQNEVSCMPGRFWKFETRVSSDTLDKIHNLGLIITI